VKEKAIHRREKSTTSLLAVSVLLVLLVTLYPFSFSDPGRIVRFYCYFQGLEFNGFFEPLANILLFVPVGLGVSRRIKDRAGALFIVLAAGAGFSLFVEVLQVSMPSRTPSAADVLMNSIGAYTGLLWHRREHASVRPLVSWRGALAGFVCYAAVLFSLSVYFTPVERFWNLSNWDAAFPLLIGNEATGNRQWYGLVSDVFIIDRVLSREEAIAAFEDREAFVNRNRLLGYYTLKHGNYSDREGNLPELLWIPEKLAAELPEGALPGDHGWLRTGEPVNNATQAISRSSAFTIGATISAAYLDQEGPARILTISQSPYEYNLTVGQQGGSLVFRLRTPFVDRGGSEVAFHVPGFFTDLAARQIIFSYNGSALALYIDGTTDVYTASVTPEAQLVWALSPGEILINITRDTGAYYRFYYYAIIFIPLGILLGIAVLKYGRPFRTQSALLVAGVAIPPVLLQILLSIAGGRVLQGSGVLSGALMTASGAAAMAVVWLAVRGLRNTAGMFSEQRAGQIVQLTVSQNGSD
jgi:glycopeptide antibiotics resistance protein